MSTKNQEVVSLHRVPDKVSIYQLGCDLTDAIENIPKEFDYRANINPDIDGVRDGGPDYVSKYVSPRQLPDGTINRWAGIQIEHQAIPNSCPRILGLVVVRPEQIVRIDTHKRKFIKRKFTLVDAWTTADNHDDVLTELLSIGKKVADTIFPKQPVATIEPIKRTPKGQTRTHKLTNNVFPYPSQLGKVHRPDPTKTLLWDGERTSSAVVFSGRPNQFDIV